MSRVRNLVLTGLAAAAAFTTPASAVTVSSTVTFSSSTNMLTSGADNELASNKFSISSNNSSAPALTVTAQGWNATANTAGSYTLSREYVGQYEGGIGVTTAANDFDGSYGLHQVDNIGTTAGSRSVDFILLTFNQAVNLTGLTRNSYGTPTGSNYSTLYDNDFTYAMIGAALTDGTTNWLPGTTYNPVNASSCGGSTGTTSANCLNQYQALSSTTAVSNRWLVAASFLSNYGGNGLVDGFKLASVNVNWSYTPPPTNQTGVPEPATWAQMILGFGVVGLGLRRRRRTAVAAA